MSLCVEMYEAKNESIKVGDVVTSRPGILDFDKLKGRVIKLEPSLFGDVPGAVVDYGGDYGLHFRELKDLVKTRFKNKEEQDNWQPRRYKKLKYSTSDGTLDVYARDYDHSIKAVREIRVLNGKKYYYNDGNLRDPSAKLPDHNLIDRFFASDLKGIPAGKVKSVDGRNVIEK